MLRLTTNRTFLLTVLFIFNLVPALAVEVKGLHWGDTFYFYWAEAVFILFFFLGLHTKHLLVFLCLMGLSFTLVKTVTEYDIFDGQIPYSFWAFYAFFWLVYVQIKQGRYSLIVRSLHPFKQFLLYIFFMGFAVLLSLWTAFTIEYGWSYRPELSILNSKIFLGLIFIVPTLSLTILRVIDMIGPHHFLLFLFGTYHRPVELNRIVLIIDMVGSSQMAEKLGPKASMEFIARFIFDVTAIFRIHGGNIVNFTGDGVVVLWPAKKPDRVFQAIAALRRQIARDSKWFKNKFGFVPQFRVGVHAGDLVISQIGEEQLFLGVYGDTINIASRLEQMNKDLNTKVLISDRLLENLSPTWLNRLTPMGEKKIKGREQGIHVYSFGTANNQ